METKPTFPKIDVLKKEKEFHDDWAVAIDPASVLVEKSFSGSTSPECKWIMNQLGDIRGKKVLELGSGAGEGAVWFAKCGAKVIATDLSPGMLRVVKQVARLHSVEVATMMVSADDLSTFSDDSFDIIYAANLLHHVNIEVCLSEVYRVLKPNGVAAFWDPVAHNPLINVYRRMASKVRTIDEHPIRCSDMKYFHRFREVRKKFFWLSSLLIFIKFYFIDRIHPNSDRYWKRILTHESEIKGFIKPLMSLDGFLLKVFPPLGWWCWNVAVIVRK